MADTFIAGATASVTLASGPTLKFFAVSVNTGQDLIDVSHFGNNYRVRIGGLNDLAGTVSGYVQTGTSTDNPFATYTGSMTIQYATGCTITFTAIIGNRQVSTDVNGSVVATYNYSNAGGDSVLPVISWT